MANKVINRRQSESSKILTNLAAKNSLINVGSNKAINDIVNKIVSSNGKLATGRSISQDKIARLNNDYIRATQDVLNDKTLDFLIKNSQIDAPTLTSIFAGFELAKASRAKKLKEQRDFDVQNIQSRDTINTDNVKAAAQQDKIRIAQIEQDRELALQQTNAEASTEIKAVTADITANERDTQLEQGRAIDANNAQIKADATVEAARVKAAVANRDESGISAFKSISNSNTTTPTDTQSGGQPIDVQPPVLPQPALLQPEEIAFFNTITLLDQNPNDSLPPVLIGENSDVNILNPDQQKLLNDARASEGGVVARLTELNARVSAQNPIIRIGEDQVPIVDPTQPVVNSATSDDQILLSDEVVAQIGVINSQSSESNIDPLSLQRTLIDNGADPTAMTIDELNEFYRTNGVQQ